MRRAETLRGRGPWTGRLAYDLVIIGGGILGSGVARDAALRGLKVALFEKDDFGSGTSSRSTRIIHGGLRYLEKFDFGLVYEALHERRRLLANAPHLVKPLPFLFPNYRGKGHPFAMLWAGIGLYDAMNLRRGMPHHTILLEEEARKLEPSLRPEGLRGGFIYYDAQCDYPERLCVENVIDAAAHGARIENHASVIGILRQDNRVEGVRIRRDDGTTDDVRATITINAAGPWLDEVEKFALPTTEPKLRRTKGVHLVVPRFNHHALIMETEDAERIFFAIPWGRHTLLGTTDTDYYERNEAVSADDDDIAYLIREIRRILDVKLEREDILYTTAGLRPLRRQLGRSTADITRKHEIFDHAREGGPEGYLTIVGGKITTFRQIAQDAVDAAEEKLGRPIRPSPTVDQPMPGGRTQDWEAFKTVFREDAAALRIPAPAVEHWLEIYGTNSRKLLELVQADPAMGEPISSSPAYLRAEVAYAVEEEFCGGLTDFLLRRSMWGFEAGQGIDALPAITGLLAPLLGWDERAIRDQIHGYLDTIKKMRGRIPSLT
jgi:glycerol-3-phosphate dehydrogenase